MVEPKEVVGRIYRGFHRWQQAWWAAQLTYGLWVGMLPALLLSLLGASRLVAVLAWLIGLLAWLAFRYFNPAGHPAFSRYLACLHQLNPPAEWSLGLLLKDLEGKNNLEQLQRQRLVLYYGRHSLLLPPPDTSWPLPALLASLWLLWLAGSLLVPAPQTQNENNSQEVLIPTAAADSNQISIASEPVELPGIGEVRLQISPPTYTGQGVTLSQLSTAGVPEGSKLTWQVEPEGLVQGLRLLVGPADSLELSKTSKGRYAGQLSASQSLVYRIQAYQADTFVLSPFYQIQVQPDRAPELSISGLEQYRADEQGRAFSFKATARDDWGLAALWLELTLSRGSGENVQFERKKQWLDAEGRQAEFELKLDPRQLGMQPGDELYFRLLAQDNRQPRWQESTTSSWYYHWQDSSQSGELSSGLALRVEAEYFRSQRQIIMDTEKLLRSGKPEPDFRQASENIGVDQKLLRLRYGKFLGEEFERAIGPGGDGHAEEEDEHMEDHGHTEEEHPEGPSSPANALNSPANPLAAYAHAHDTEEGATFYEESIKRQLKKALAAMWESELQLRTIQPAQALPYQYQALRIIKEIQQQSRVYVERVGFDPPPIPSEQIRLSGEYGEARAPQIRSSFQVQDSLLYLKGAIDKLSYWLVRQPLSPELKLDISRYSQALALQIARGKGNSARLELLNRLDSLLKQQDLEPEPARRLLALLEKQLPPHSPAYIEARSYPMFKLEQP